MHERLDVARLQQGLRVPHRVLAQTASTNAVMRGWAREGAPHGAAVLAEHQTAGRGRLGRVWQSPPAANVLLSVLIRPSAGTWPASAAPLLCLAASVAVAHACGSWARIKWPNDVLGPDGRKVAGILAEAENARPVSGTPTLAWAILGIGVNVHAAPDLAHAATVTAYASGAVDRTALALDVIQGAVAWSEGVLRDPEPMRSAWRARSATLGAEVQVGDVRGTAIDLQADGALLVRTADRHVHAIRSGDVTMVYDGALKPLQVGGSGASGTELGVPGALVKGEIRRGQPGRIFDEEEQELWGEGMELQRGALGQQDRFGPRAMIEVGERHLAASKLVRHPTGDLHLLQVAAIEAAVPEPMTAARAHAVAREEVAHAQRVLGCVSGGFPRLALRQPLGALGFGLGRFGCGGFGFGLPLLLAGPLLRFSLRLQLARRLAGPLL